MDVAERATPVNVKGRMGTGLTWADLALLAAVSIALFVLWPTLLWNAPRDASHVSRFAVSYLAVIPFAAIQLAYRRHRVPVRELTAAVLIVWSVKMLVTVGLYEVFATQGRAKYDPPVAQEHFAHAEKHGYVGIAGFHGAAVRGRVLYGKDRTAPDAWVYVPGVRKGVPIAPAAKREIVPVEILKDKISPSLLVIVAGTTIRFENFVGATVVLSGVLDGRTHYNVPVVPGSDGRTVRLDKPGRVTFTSRVGPTDGVMRVQVVDNPYVARTSSDGTFTLRDLPEGAFEVVALATGEGSVLLESRMPIAEGEPLALVLAPVELSDGNGETLPRPPAAGS